MFGVLIIEKNNNCLNKKTWRCFTLNTATFVSERLMV